MTITIKVTHESGSHADTLVEAFNPKNGNIIGYPTKRLSEGESTTITVHSDCAVRVIEIPKVVVQVKE
jgi:hypothetical protein